MSQPYDLHRALLRPSIIHMLRAAGFHSTKPSVLDTLVTLAERYLMLLATTTATHARYSHNDPVPSITDVRMALTECGVLTPVAGAAEEDWRERMRRPLKEIEQPANGGRARAQAEKRRRDEEDLKDVRDFVRWFDSSAHSEMRRVAGLLPDMNTMGTAGVPAVGVGGGIVQAEDFLTVLKKKHGKAGEDARFAGTLLGPPTAVEEERKVIIEGGPVQNLWDWRPPKVLGKRPREEVEPKREKEDDDDMGNLSSSTIGHEDALMKDITVEE